MNRVKTAKPRPPKTTGGQGRLPTPMMPPACHRLEAKPMADRLGIGGQGKHGFLKEINLFEDFSPSELGRVEEITACKKYPKGKILYSSDEPAELLFILKKGKVRIYEISPEGKELTLAIVDEGTIFGEMSLAGQGMYDAFAETLEESDLCVLNKVEVRNLLLSHPKAALKIIKILGNRLRETEEKLEDLAFKDVTSRLASFLIRLATKNNLDNGLKKPYRPTKFTHQELAEMIGTSRETLTRALSEFKAKSLIAIDHKQIQLLDPEGLEKISLASH